MPELPEVEVTKLSLESILNLPVQLKSIDFFRGDLRDPIPQKLCKKAEGEYLRRLSRRAKYILLEFDSVTLVSHLGMTGTWRVLNKESEKRAHDHLQMTFANGKTLVYNDPRRFGTFDGFECNAEKVVYKRFEHLGVEPLSDEFDAKGLRKSLAGKSISIKAAIMDQRVVVGVGNIYASEALFRAKIKPTRKASMVTMEELKKLVSSIRKILADSIKKGGSSISDFSSASESQGYFQKSFFVYDRAGESCRVCKTKIQSKVISGRNTFWCRSCQR